MKVIKEGIDPRRPLTKWWAGRKTHCPVCQVEVVLDTDDMPTHGNIARSPKGVRSATFACPSMFDVAGSQYPFSCHGSLLISGFNDDPPVGTGNS